MKKLHFIICMIILALMSLSIGPTGQALAESLSDDFENPPLDLNTWEILTTGGTVEVTQDGSLGVLLLSGGGSPPHKNVRSKAIFRHGTAEARIKIGEVFSPTSGQGDYQKFGFNVNRSQPLSNLGIYFDTLDFNFSNSSNFNSIYAVVWGDDYLAQKIENVTWGEYHIFKIVWDEQGAEFYVDGELKATFDIDLQSNTDLSIGLWNDRSPSMYVDWVQAAPLNRPPVVTEAFPSIETIWPPNNKMVDITIEGVTDPEGDPVEITITGIEGGDPDDVDGIGSSTAQVRAQRDGKGKGRIYEISFVASDDQATSLESSVTVTVPHDQGKGKTKGRAGKLIANLGSDASGLLLGLGAFELGGRFKQTSETLTFELAPNFPNPFNPSTTIQYALAEASDVRLTIYNVLGQPVRVLVHGGQGSGIHSVVWDGRDAFGKEVTSGIYLYRLVVGADVMVRKMMLVK